MAHKAISESRLLILEVGGVLHNTRRLNEEGSVVQSLNQGFKTWFLASLQGRTHWWDERLRDRPIVHYELLHAMEDYSCTEHTMHATLSHQIRVLPSWIHFSCR